MSLIGNLAKAVAKNAASGSPISYARAGYTTNSLMQSGTDPAAYMRAYGASGTVFAIVSILARQTAKKNWHLYREQPQDGRRRYTTADKGSDQRTEVLKHQAMSVWNKPNPFMTGFMLRELSQTYLDLTGESYLIVKRDGRATFPTGLWPVRPDRMEPVPHAEKFLAGYIYTGPSGEAVPLQPDEVIMTKYPNPYDIYHGLGPVQAILVDIDAGKYSAQWNRNFFLNSATPGGVIQVDKRLSDEEWNEFTDRWRESHRGVGAAHRVAVLEQGATWVSNAHSQRDMDYMNLRNVSRDVIREAFTMHKAILGTTDDVNRANSITAQEHFESFLLTDRLDRWRDVLNCFYLPLFGSTGDGVEMDHDDAVTSNREADALELKEKATSAQALVDAGFDPHDVLEIVGLPDMGVVEKATQVPALPPGWVPGTTPNAAPEPDAPPAVKPANRARALPRAASAPAATLDLSEMDAQHTAASDQLAADYAAQITPQQREQVLAQIRQLVAAGSIGALGAITLNHAAAKLLLLGAMTKFGTASAQQASKEAQRQGATAPPVAPQQPNLDAVAEATAGMLATELALTAGREAARAAGGSATPDPDAVAEHVGRFLDGLSEAGRRSQLAGALAAAQNQARHATFTAGPRCELIASEINDRATCAPCELIDGHSFGYSDNADAVASAAAAYPTSGYIACEGRDRCRGALAADYTASGPVDAVSDRIPWWLHDLNEAPADLNGHARHETGAR